MGKRIPSQHEDGCLMGKEVGNEKREMKETADPKGQGSGYFWSKDRLVMRGRSKGEACVWWLDLGYGCVGVYVKISH